MKIRSSTPFRMTLSQGQEKTLDVIWSKAVKSLAGNKCELCKSESHLQSHHVIGRRNKTLRHVVSNGCCLCAKHHFFAEQNGIAFSEWIIKKRGMQWWDDLNIQSNKIKVWKEFSLIKKYLESFL